MSEEQTITEGTREVVDLVAFDPEGNVVLGLVDTESWGDEQRLVDLQERVNVYLAYWDSGQLAADFPDSAWKPIAIRLYLSAEPDSDGEDFLEQLREGLQTHNIGFAWQLLGDVEE